MKLYARFGVQIALAMIALALALRFSGLANSTGPGRWLGMLAMMFPIVGIPWGIREWRETVGGGYLPFNRGLQVGVFIVMWWAVPAAVFNVIYTTWINPGVIQAAISAEMAEAESRGLSPAMIEVMEKIFGFMLHPVVQIFTGIVGTMIWGVIIAMIATAILKRDPPPVPPPLPPHAAD